MGLHHDWLEIGGRHYEIEGKGAGGRNSKLIGGVGGTPKPNLAPEEKTRLGATSKSQAEIEGFNEKWQKRYPDYKLGEIDCQTFTRDLAGWMGFDCRLRDNTYGGRNKPMHIIGAVGVLKGAAFGAAAGAACGGLLALNLLQVSETSGFATVKNSTSRVLNVEVYDEHDHVCWCPKYTKTMKCGDEVELKGEQGVTFAGVPHCKGFWAKPEAHGQCHFLKNGGSYFVKDIPGKGLRFQEQ